MQTRQTTVLKPIAWVIALIQNIGWKTFSPGFIVGSCQWSLVGLSLAALLLLAPDGQAQDHSLLLPESTDTDSSRGYWRLQTQAADRSTRVRFYAQDHRLLYEEIIPEKWVHLNRKNQKQLDRLLAQLTANQLLVSRIKTQVMPLTPDVPTPTVAPTRSGGDPSAETVPVSYKVHAYASQIGKIYLIVNNPERLRYRITVADQQGRLLYEEFTNHNRYLRRLDVSAVPDAKCKLTVFIGNKPIVYHISRNSDRTTYDLQPIEAQQANAVPACQEANAYSDR